MYFLTSGRRTDVGSGDGWQKYTFAKAFFLSLQGCKCFHWEIFHRMFSDTSKATSPRLNILELSKKSNQFLASGLLFVVDYNILTIWLWHFHRHRLHIKPETWLVNPVADTTEVGIWRAWLTANRLNEHCQTGAMYTYQDHLSNNMKITIFVNVEWPDCKRERIHVHTFLVQKTPVFTEDQTLMIKSQGQKAVLRDQECFAPKMKLKYTGM